MAGRKRRSVTWLPTIGTAGGEGIDDNASGRQFSIAVSGDGETAVNISALTFDRPVDADTASLTEVSLSDFVGSEYMLRRIVGKLFAAFITTASSPLAGLFGAGFFVARAADESQATGGDQPIGSQSLVERRENYNPLSDDCIREPWIWRRTWILGSGGTSTIVLNPGVGTFPNNTALYGSVADGPHIDAQTMRRVTQDERLWFVIAARAFPIAVTSEASASIFGYLDYRLLGNLLKARNRGVF